MKTNVNSENKIINLLGVVKALQDLVETKQILLKQSLPMNLRRLYEKQIFDVIDKYKYLQNMIVEEKEKLELTTDIDEKKSLDIDDAITRVFSDVFSNNLKTI